MCSVMMLSSLMRKLLKFIFSVFSQFQLKNIWFLTQVHLSLLSAFASRVDAWIYLPCLLVVCLLTSIHMVAICKKYPFITKVLYLSKDGWWRLWGPCQTQSYKISSLWAGSCYVHQASGSQWLSIRIVAWQSELSLPYLRGFIISFLLKEMKPSFGLKGSSWWILSSPGLTC